MNVPSVRKFITVIRRIFECLVKADSYLSIVTVNVEFNAIIAVYTFIWKFLLNLFET